MFDPMSELSDGEDTLSSDTDESVSDTVANTVPVASAPSGRSGVNGRFAQELQSVTIHARQRTFYIDLKQSGHGKFFKVSEKSRGGQKSTIMFDVEDLDKFIEALQEMKQYV